VKIFYDTEYIDDGNTIELVSIGMVADNDDSLYLINGELGIDRLYEHAWLRENVLPHLPITVHNFTLEYSDGTTRDHWLEWNESHPDYAKVYNRSTIAGLVSSFIRSHRTNGIAELWAWYGAYDHVALAQLFGPMVNLPYHIPKWTNDLRQSVMRMEQMGGREIDLPNQKADEHNALADAKHLKYRYDWLVKQFGAVS
jgi:hypothetical protein